MWYNPHPFFVVSKAKVNKVVSSIPYYSEGEYNENENNAFHDLFGCALL